MNAEDLENRRQAVCKDIADWQGENPKANSINYLGKAVGISGATLSQIQRGNYPGNLVKMIERLEKHFEMLRERTAVSIDPDYVATGVGRRIERFASTVHVGRTIGVLTGSAGLGKTKALKNYAANQPAAVYIQVHPFMQSKREFLLALCAALDVKGSKNATAAFDRLRVVASERNTLFILDDMQVLSNPKRSGDIFEIIRALHDGGAAVLLSGNLLLVQRVTRSDEESFYQQFASRALLLNLRDAVEPDDVRAVVEALLPNDTLPAEYLDYLHQVARRHYGSLRLVARILTYAVLRANAQRIKLTLAHLQGAASLMMAELKPEFRNERKGDVIREIQFSDVKKTNGGDNAEPEKRRATA